ncbi:MAG: non-hydrolyzing UDP-N-acetylglucosamine 2-epimerase [bacterium]
MKIASIVGARPQFIKLMPIVKAIEKYKVENNSKIHHIIIHTGQHYDYLMDKVFFDELGLPEPDYNLEVGSGTHGYQTGEMIRRIEEVLIKEGPNLVLVYGDTNSTLAGALTAAKLHIPIAHIEAGLRSYNKKMPEEINRVLTDHLSDYLFCPTQASVRNLEKEGITQGVYLVGDVMYDAALQCLEIAEKKSNILEKLNLKPKEFILCTIHRAENTDNKERLKSIFLSLIEIANNGILVIFPMHPRTKNVFNSLGYSINSLPNNLRIIEPVSYFDMLVLEKNAKAILTDSGGVQKEAFFFRVPCVTLREETEWVETVETGWNVLAGCELERIVQAALEPKKGKSNVWPYGDGKAGVRIIKEVTCKDLKLQEYLEFKGETRYGI